MEGTSAPSYDSVSICVGAVAVVVVDVVVSVVLIVVSLCSDDTVC